MEDSINGYLNSQGNKHLSTSVSWLNSVSMFFIDTNKDSFAALDINRFVIRALDLIYI